LSSPALHLADQEEPKGPSSSSTGDIGAARNGPQQATVAITPVMAIVTETGTPPPTAPLPTPATIAPPASSLAQKTLAGFFWLTAQTFGSKLVNMAGQVILAWILKPDAFGLIGLAYTVTAFAGLIQQAGLREILIHRQAKFARWANPAFWMSLTLGCVGCLAMLALAPVAWWMYEEGPLLESQLLPLILVLAATAPFSALDTVPDARLTSEMRFGYLAGVKCFTAIGQMALSIAFALMGFGALSFVLPVPIITAARLALLWGPLWRSRETSAIRIRPQLQIRRWKYLFGDGLTLLLANFFVMLTWQGDYIILGTMHDMKTVGIYFFAFNLSIQTMQVFTSNLTGVLFPALSRLQDDPVHQTRAFLQAAAMLAVVGVPLCLLQAALAGPAVSIAFNSWWQPAIRVLQLLSIGMAIRIVSSPGGSLIQAQGRFKTYLLVNIVNATVFLALVWAGARLGERTPSWLMWIAKDLHAAALVAAAVALYFALIGPIFMYIAVRPGGGTARDVWHVYAGPCAAAFLAVGAAVVAGRMVPAMPDYDDRLRQAVRFLAIGVWSVVLYILLIRLLAPAAFSQLVSRMASLYRRKASLSANPA
jgi:PST family polysaccharide transporter